jgi:hypothetical protein
MDLYTIHFVSQETEMGPVFMKIDAKSSALMAFRSSALAHEYIAKRQDWTSQTFNVHPLTSDRYDELVAKAQAHLPGVQIFIQVVDQ